MINALLVKAAAALTMHGQSPDTDTVTMSSPPSRFGVAPPPTIAAELTAAEADTAVIASWRPPPLRVQRGSASVSSQVLYRVAGAAIVHPISGPHIGHTPRHRPPNIALKHAGSTRPGVGDHHAGLAKPRLRHLRRVVQATATDCPAAAGARRDGGLSSGAREHVGKLAPGGDVQLAERPSQMGLHGLLGH